MFFADTDHTGFYLNAHCCNDHIYGRGIINHPCCEDRPTSKHSSAVARLRDYFTCRVGLNIIVSRNPDSHRFNNNYRIRLVAIYRVIMVAGNGSSNIVTGEYRLEHKKLRIVD